VHLPGAQLAQYPQASLFLQNERYQDTVVIEHLVRASRRGVKVHVMTRPPHTLKLDKLLEGVGGRSLDERREPAIEVRDEEVVERLYKVARHDWDHSHPLDLSDAGLPADLNERAEEALKLRLIDGSEEGKRD
jgi:cardiolipin synthase A/B